MICVMLIMVGLDVVALIGYKRKYGGKKRRSC
jgi:hypothetical protein